MTWCYTGWGTSVVMSDTCFTTWWNFPDSVEDSSMQILEDASIKTHVHTVLFILYHHFSL